MTCSPDRKQFRSPVGYFSLILSVPILQAFCEALYESKLYILQVKEEEISPRAQARGTSGAAKGLSIVVPENLLPPITHVGSQPKKVSWSGEFEDGMDHLSFCLHAYHMPIDYRSLASWGAMFWNATVKGR